MVGLPGEFLPEFRVLCRNANRACIQMTFAHHDAAEGDQRCGCKSVLFCSQQRCDSNIPACLQLSVCLQVDARTQIVHDQCLLCFCQTQFPRNTRMFNAGQRRCPGSPVVTGDHEVIRFGLCNARCDGTHADFGSQFDADACFRIRVLQVMNQLRDIFDGVDIVMWWRADQSNAWRRMADSRNRVIHFTTWQLTAFAGLGALYDLDLQLIGVCKVPDRDTKAA